MHDIQRLVDTFDEYESSSYTGRGMREECLAVALPAHETIFDFFSFILRSCEDPAFGPHQEEAPDLNAMADAFSHARSESLGKGAVIYFPGIKHDASGDVEEDENDD